MRNTLLSSVEWHRFSVTLVSSVPGVLPMGPCIMARLLLATALSFMACHSSHSKAIELHQLALWPYTCESMELSAVT